MEPTRVIVIHDTLVFQQIREAFSECDMTVEEWISDETPVDITQEPPKNAVFYNRCSATSHNRGHRYSLEQSRTICRWLHKHNRVVINGLQAVDLEESKSYQFICAKDSGLPVPESFTASVVTESAIRRRFGEHAPFIIKPDRGGSGIDVRRYENLLEFIADKEPKIHPEGLFVVQRYIPNDDGIHRAEFVGGRHLYTSRAMMAESGSFCPNMCPRDLPSTQFKILKDFSHPIIKLCEKFLADVGVENAGIEFIFDTDNQPYVIDVNTNTIYNTAAERENGLESGFVMVAKYIYNRLLQLPKDI